MIIDAHVHLFPTVEVGKMVLESIENDTVLVIMHMELLKNI